MFARPSSLAAPSVMQILGEFLGEPDDQFVGDAVASIDVGGYWRVQRSKAQVEI